MFFNKPDRIGQRCEYAVIDKERNITFSCTIGWSLSELKCANFDIREVKSNNALLSLWKKIKIESPGTFLKCKKAGWLDHLLELERQKSPLLVGIDYSYDYLRDKDAN